MALAQLEATRTDSIIDDLSPQFRRDAQTLGVEGRSLHHAYSRTKGIRASEARHRSQPRITLEFTASEAPLAQTFPLRASKGLRLLRLSRLS